MIVIVPALLTARTFCDQAKRFADRHQLPMPANALKHCMKVVHALFHKALADQMRWIPFETNRRTEALQIDPQSGSYRVTDQDLLITDQLLAPNAHVAKAMQRIFPWYSQDDSYYQTTAIADINDAFYVDVMDPIWLMIQDAVSKTVTEPTWTIWRLKTHGQDLYLESGEDYRICDWNRTHQVPEEEPADTEVIEDDTPLPRAPVGTLYALQFLERTRKPTPPPARMSAADQYFYEMLDPRNLFNLHDAPVPVPRISTAPTNVVRGQRKRAERLFDFNQRHETQMLLSDPKVHKFTRGDGQVVQYVESESWWDQGDAPMKFALTEMIERRQELTRRRSDPSTI